MSLPPASVCLKDDSTFYIPIDNTTPPIGYCLCPDNTGIFDFKDDNTGSDKCSLDLVYNSVPWAQYTSNSPLIQHNFKYSSSCLPGYTAGSVVGYSNYIKCTATTCPPNWTLVGGSNCERVINGVKRIVDLKTLGYVAIPSGTEKYEIPTADIKPELKEVSTPDYTKIYRILKIIGLVIIGLITLGIIGYLVSKLFSRSEQSMDTPTNTTEMSKPLLMNEIKYVEAPVINPAPMVTPPIPNNQLPPIVNNQQGGKRKGRK
jgi:hypothetical protein